MSTKKGWRQYATKQILYGFTLPNPDLLTIRQVAAVLRCTPEHIAHLIRAQCLEGLVRPRGKRIEYRIPRASLVRFIEERTTGPFECDCQSRQAPHNLELPEGDILLARQVADFLECTPEHVSKLIGEWELLATNIARSGARRAAYRISRTGLVQFINSRTEGIR